jgi:hypothetical protein
VEGPSAAGPIGGTDVRSAMLPPPGLYGGGILLGAGTVDFVDGNGRSIPELKDAHLEEEVGGPFVYYVPDVKVLGGSVGIGGILPIGNLCGRLFTGTSEHCQAGVGDPYVEIDWSRFFGRLRSSKVVGAYPVPEGLSIMVGFGAVFPTGKFDASDPLSQALSIGTNIWDFAPSVALTYTTPPILAEGTEISLKFYWNNYLENPATRYRTGDLLDLDFAITEHIGRFQVGLAGFYAFQIEDDRQFGAPVAPDGRRAEVLKVGGVVNYDMPEYAASVRVKAVHALIAANTVEAWAAMIGWFKKF